MSKISIGKDPEIREENDGRTQHLYQELNELSLYVKPEKERILFQHMYQEKIFYLSFKNRQSITTGLLPSRNRSFKFCIRLDDFRYCSQIFLTLYQYVNLMKQVRKLILSSEQEKYYDKADANLQFRFKDMNAPTVLIKRHSIADTPILYRFSFPREDGEMSEGILFKPKTLRKMIEWEDEILNTLRPLESKPCTYLFNSFIEKCVDILKEIDIVIEPKSIYPLVKTIPKTAFQSEVFLKFWSLICVEIINKLIQIRKSEVVL